MKAMDGGHLLPMTFSFSCRYLFPAFNLYASQCTCILCECVCHTFEQISWQHFIFVCVCMCGYDVAASAIFPVLDSAVVDNDDVDYDVTTVVVLSNRKKTSIASVTNSHIAILKVLTNTYVKLKNLYTRTHSHMYM